MDPKLILKKILDLTAYQGNKELFIKTFFDTCQKKAIYGSVKNGQELDTKVYAQNLTKISQEALGKYMASIKPILTTDAKKELSEYIESLR